ncbi:MAG TPA: tetratricopeptide repeat protein [Parafilimonas sp.]|nr:tetratricopeptide repeat protein [Parafilimonas sp.]
MRKFIFFLITILFFTNCFSQDEQTDSLLALLNKTKEDTSRVNILNQVAVSYFNNSPENAIKYAMQAKTLAENTGYTNGLAYALKNIGIAYYMQADYVQTLTYWNQSLKQFENLKDKKGIANILGNIGAVYNNQADEAKALDYYLQALNYAEEIHDTLRLATVLNNIGALYFNRASAHDKALSYYLQALPLCEKIGDDDAIGTISVNIGEIYLEKGEDALALQYFERSLNAYGNSKNAPYALIDIAKVYKKRKDYSTAIKYNTQALNVATKLSAKLEMSQSFQGLAAVYFQMNDIPKTLETYKKAEAIAKEISANYELEKIYKGLADTYAKINDHGNAYKYQSLLLIVKDTLYNAEKDKKFALLLFNAEIQKKQAEIDLLTRDKSLQELDLKRQKTVRNSLIAVLSLVVLVGFILFRNYRIIDKTNAMLDSQKKELERTLNELQTRQAQLIQSEKMASLGELTAGIAHEIQNPLNFVNNFSEVSRELIGELKEERQKEEAVRNIELEDETISDIDQNLEKIYFHGKRADAIVKGMLQHSRKSTGQKEPIDINAMCEECLRLSYHGLRAKDKSFNSEYTFNFDRTTGAISVVPQDIVRVLLNLFNNAFYAVNEKKKTLGEKYKPIVSVRTKKISAPSGNGAVEIVVKDNGKGIAEDNLGKIFQPFFTTKPAGEGTGLGLSLSYDIITKEHGGTIKVESKKGEGSEFIITLNK